MVMNRVEHIRVELTNEQVHLYHTSATFKAGVDQFMLFVVPAFFSGLALTAEQADVEHAMRIEAIQGAPLKLYVDLPPGAQT